MLKTYTNSSTTSENNVKSPKEGVLNTILNFSKSLEIIPVTGMDDKMETKIELILN